MTHSARGINYLSVNIKRDMGHFRVRGQSLLVYTVESRYHIITAGYSIKLVTGTWSQPVTGHKSWSQSTERSGYWGIG